MAMCMAAVSMYSTGSSSFRPMFRFKSKLEGASTVMERNFGSTFNVSPFFARFFLSFSSFFMASSAKAIRRFLSILFTIRNVSVFGTNCPNVSVAK